MIVMVKMLLTSLAFLVILPCSQQQTAGEVNDEARLLMYLREQNKEKNARPVITSSDAITVSIEFVLIQVLDLNLKNNTVEVHGMPRMTWNNSISTWDPDQYGGLKYVLFNYGEIWTPDIVMINALRSEALQPLNLLLYSNGLTYFVPPYRYLAICAPKEDRSPSHRPSCVLKFGSWSQDTSKVDLKSAEERMDTSMYVKNTKWLLGSTTAERNAKSYACCPGSMFADVTFTFELYLQPSEDEKDDKKDSLAAILISSHWTIAIAAFSVWKIL